jgi:hypothetical protein
MLNRRAVLKGLLALPAGFAMWASSAWSKPAHGAIREYDFSGGVRGKYTPACSILVADVGTPTLSEDGGLLCFDIPVESVATIAEPGDEIRFIWDDGIEGRIAVSHYEPLPHSWAFRYYCKRSSGGEPLMIWRQLPSDEPEPKFGMREMVSKSGVVYWVPVYSGAPSPWVRS